jgi:hypothetical protein
MEAARPLEKVFSGKAMLFCITCKWFKMSKLVLGRTPLVAVQAWEGFFIGLRRWELACRIFHGIDRFGDYRCFGLVIWSIPSGL